MPDPQRTTRQDYTTAICSMPIPATANADWEHEMDIHRRLVKALLTHEAMAPNRDQIFMVPSNKKSRVYYLWDFVQRTICYLNIVNPNSPSGKDWANAVNRSAMTKAIILDDRGMSHAMFQDDKTPYGDDVMAIAREMKGAS
jgi:hypothetical protein